MDWKEHGVKIVHAAEPGHEHAADVRDDAGGGDHACPNGRRETVGGHDGGNSSLARRDR
jgi:hypothetical protein